MSDVTYHVSHVTCYMSCVICHWILYVIFFIRQWGRGSPWRVCYKLGFNRLGNTQSIFLHGNLALIGSLYDDCFNNSLTNLGKYIFLTQQTF